MKIYISDETKTCPRCNVELQRHDEREVQSLWRVDKYGVVINCRRQVIEVSYAVCGVCSFREITDFQRCQTPVTLCTPVNFN